MPYLTNSGKVVEKSTKLFFVIAIILAMTLMAAGQSAVRYFYDDLGRLIRVVDQDGKVGKSGTA